MKRTKILLLLLTLLVASALVLAACGGGATEEPMEEAPAEEAPTEAPMEEAPTEDTGAGIVAEEATSTPAVMEEGSMFNEAPMLAEMVAAGDLPPVDERLPDADNLMVIAPVDGVGEYGGTWHNASWWQGMGNIQMAVYESPVVWKADYSGYEPGLLKSWEYSDDGTQLTWNFRQGIKWSDGEPFIPKEDLGYWWELAVNEDFAPIAIPGWGRDSDGTPMEVTFPDDYTMVFTWNEPHFVATFFVAQGYWEWLPMETAKHWITQYDPNYTEGMTYDDLEGATNGDTTVWLMNIEGRPCLHAWCPTTVTPGERTILTRNPYYWKVDTEGNQLPYIDYVDTVLQEDAEARLLDVSQGKYEASFRGTDDPTNIPFLLEQADANDFTLWPGAVNGAGGWESWIVDMNFNDCETYPDTCEEIRTLLQNQDFRIGLSTALDRDRYIDVVWGGIGYPTNTTISPQSWHFASSEGQAVYEEWRDAYTEYDPEGAMALFDGIGFVDADGDGWRDLPSGAPFTLVIDQDRAWTGDTIVTSSNETYASDLNAVGINVLINDVTNTPENTTRFHEGLFMLKNAHASEIDIWTYPDWIFPLRDTNPRAWPLEGGYRESGGERGWEPQPNTTWAYELQQIYDQGSATASVDDRHQLVWDAIRIHIDHGPFMIGGSGDQQMPVVVRNGFHGIADVVVLGPWAPASPGNQHPEQYWMEASLRGE